MALESTRVEAYAKNVVLSVAAIIQSEDRKVLVILEGDTPYHDMWVIPMGYVHANENVADAVSREVREETGIEIEIEGLIGVYDDFIDTDGRDLHHVIVCYRTKALTDPPIVSREAKEYVWTDRRRVGGLRAPTVVKNMLSDYFRSG
jgi:ADP-ribose pyrophosphatase YjhB (NUDIX family)